jgi:hypothetical protein
MQMSLPTKTKKQKPGKEIHASEKQENQCTFRSNTQKNRATINRRRRPSSLL